MPEQPSPLNAKNLSDALRQMQQLLDDLYNERLAGARPGNVFQISAQDETLNLKLAPSGGLSDAGNVLSVLVDPAGCVTKSSLGLDVSLVSTTKKGALKTLPNDDTKYMDGKGNWTVPSQVMWPIGSVFLSVVSTTPSTLLGFGTWSQIAQGQMLVGFKTGDADFGVVEGAGGNKTVTHTNNHSGGSATISAQPTAHGTDTINDPGTGGTVKTVLTNTNNHSGTAVTHSDPSAHGDHNIINPFFTIYVWKRTA